MTEGKKHDAGKLRYDLFPAEALKAIVEVLTKGAEKYDDNNWKHVDNAMDRYYAAQMRHVEDDRQGELFDSEWELLSLAHAATCAVFRLQIRLEQVASQKEDGLTREYLAQQELADRSREIMEESGLVGTRRPKANRRRITLFDSSGLSDEQIQGITEHFKSQMDEWGLDLSPGGE